MFNRRQLFGAGAALVSTAAFCKDINMSLPEAAIMESPTSQFPNRPRPGEIIIRSSHSMAGLPVPDEQRCQGGFTWLQKPVERELAEGTIAYLWGYNGQSPVRPLKRSRATVSASLSPTSFPNIPPFTGMA